MTPLTIVLAKGRLLDPSIALFNALGYDLSEAHDSRKLMIETGGARFLLAKPMDVPIYVEYGAADAGIVGQDVLRESEVNVYEPLTLNFGVCRLMVAGKPEYRDAEWKMLAGLCVATKYPRIAKKYFAARGLSAEIIEVYGSVELASTVGLANLIVDVVQTGRTLRENGLVELEEIFKSQAALIVNRAAHTLRAIQIRELIEHLQTADRGLRTAVRERPELESGA